VTHEEKVALVYAIVYAVPVFGLAALFAWRVAGRPNRSFRAALPFIGLGVAVMIGAGLAVATHYFGTIA
jgi:hypothetical protein